MNVVSPNPFTLIWARKWRFFLVFAILCALGYAGLGALPQVYRSKAEILLVIDSVPDSLLDRSFLGFSDENASRLFARYKTREYIQAVLEDFEGLFELIEQNDKAGLDRLTDQLISGLKLEFLYEEVDMAGYYVPIRLPKSFYLTADSNSSSLSTFLVNRIAQAIVDDNDQMQRGRAQAAIDFLSSEQKKLSQKLQSLQKDILSLESQYYAELPLDERSKRENLGRLETSTENLRVSIAARESLLRKIDAQISQFGTDEMGSGDAPLLALVSKLDEAKRDLKLLGSLYSSDYPDVQQSMQMTVDLEAKLENLTPGASNYSSEKISYLGDLKAQREVLNVRLQELNFQLHELENQSDQLKKNLRGGTPIEGQYRSLLLQENGISEQLRILKKKEYTAQTMLGLSKNQLLGGFSIKKRAQASPDPLYPNVFAWMILLAYVAIIIAATITLNGLGQSEEVRSSLDLKLAVGDAVLGAVPKISNS